MEMNRREAMKSLATTLGTAAALTSIPAFAAEKEKPVSNALILTTEEIKSKPLPFDSKKLHGISEKLITSHWENNYGGSVKILNAVNRKLSSSLLDKDFLPFAYNGLKREHLMRTGSVVFHELYFGNLGGNGKSGGEIEKAIKTSFSDFNTWETEFRRIAQGLGGGSGLLESLVCY
jgi:Fe-Mn family superoxide dismutase